MHLDYITVTMTHTIYHNIITFVSFLRGVLTLSNELISCTTCPPHMLEKELEALVACAMSSKKQPKRLKSSIMGEKITANSCELQQI